ncbi:hypothetical protein A2U01_0009937, partial [Trifolium medium]|nr:hypothetical protein [Trifolium medium]
MSSSSTTDTVNDAKHNFSHPEMYKKNLTAGTVESYGRHTKITVYEACEEDGSFDGDVLILPEMINY